MLALLLALVLAAETSGDYNKAAWWTHWTDADGDCQDARQEVLAVQSITPARFTSDGCTVVAGSWIDPYTGDAVSRPTDLDIDHLVSLKEAHESGGASWSAQKKHQFAQDQENLRAVLASTNRSKQDFDPGEWLPAKKDRACTYVRAWVAIKEKWKLTGDRKEQDAIDLLQEQCPK